jgi:repressor LexA
MSVSGLTKRQSTAYRFIKSYTERAGYSPSYGEIADALNLRSKSGVHRVIHGLTERGLISQLPNRSRSIRVTAGKCPFCGRTFTL